MRLTLTGNSAPRADVEFGDVAPIWCANQGGQLQDHTALGVTDLDAWFDKLLSKGVALVKEHYTLGDTRAVMTRAAKRWSSSRRVDR